MAPEQDTPKELTYEQARAIALRLDQEYGWPIDPIIDWLKEQWNKIQEWISSEGSWIVNTIRGALDWLRDRVWEIVSWVWNWIWDAINWLWSQVWWWISWLKDRVWDSVDRVWDWIVDQVTRVWNWVWESVNWLWGQVWWWINWVKDRVWERVGEVWSWIQGAINTLWGWIRPYFDWLWGPISNTWNWLTQTLWSKVKQLDWWLYSHLPEILKQIHAQAQLTLGIPPEIERTVGDPITDALEGLVKQVPLFLQNFWNYVLDNLGRLWAKILPFAQKYIIDPLTLALGWVQDKALEIAQAVIDGVIGICRRFAPVAPAGSVDIAKQLMTLGAAAAGGLAAMTIAGELVHPMKSIGMGHISAMIYDVTNYKAISGIFMGVLLGAAIKTPLGYYANELLRPWLLRDRDLMELWSRGAFEKPERLNNPDLYPGLAALPGGGGAATKSAMMGYYGYPGGYVGLFDELANTRIGYFALAAVAREGVFDEDWFWESLSRAGYSETVKTRLIDMYRRQGTGELRTLSVSPVMRRYREGFTDYNQFVQEMRMLGYPDKAIDSYRMVADLEYQTDYYTDLLAVYKDAHYKQLITTGEYRSMLRELGIRPERAEAYIDRAEIRLTPKPKPPPKPEVMPLYRRDIGAVRYREALTAFRGRVIDSGELYRRLTELEVPYDVAEATLRIEEAKLGLIEPLKEIPEKPLYETEEGKVRVRTLVEAFRKDNIDQGELFSGLLELEMEYSLVDALVHYELERKAPPPVKPPPEVPQYKTEAGRFRFQAAQLLYYPAKLITRGELIDSLERLETGSDLADAIADYLDVKWLLKPPPPVEPPEPMYLTPVGKVRHKTLIEAFRKQAITDYDLRSGLVALQMDEDLAKAIVMYEGIRLLPKPE